MVSDGWPIAIDPRLTRPAANGRYLVCVQIAGLVTQPPLNAWIPMFQPDLPLRSSTDSRILTVPRQCLHQNLRPKIFFFLLHQQLGTICHTAGAILIQHLSEKP